MQCLCGFVVVAKSSLELEARMPCSNNNLLVSSAAGLALLAALHVHLLLRHGHDGADVRAVSWLVGGVLDGQAGAWQMDEV